MNNKILIVDDDINILEPLSLIIELEGYQVLSISKGEETYETVGTFKPDLLLLDILMSGSDGRDICRKLKSLEKTKNLPVILMSAHPTAKADAWKCGADDFIAKPFETNDLITKISHLVNKY
jgi:DNA-binding response OmpR family regulator